ncbi:MarR family transcriptional regulator [Guyparkeria halophila]|uniref:Transcriptional regulator MntR n=1 Tax=Guyparkeria halophila TaxID=47960 RepID=A0A6I6D0F5_9GAMM|nr:metal-dependent transcriptional regulator [Guyparkeria halophila]QGT77755.1 MarR family transcriptional regulator [Guyparkeria halophila]
MASTAYEDYLKAIFKLAEQSPEPAVSTSAIADRLGIARASVTAMLKRLHADGLIHYARYQGAALTDAGWTIAVDMIRRHRVIETFLAQDLKLPLAEVDAEAEILEHAFSSRLIDRLWDHLGQPEFDPHGAPIPRPDEAPVERRQMVALGSLAIDEGATVVRLAAENAADLRRLTQLGILPGQFVRRRASQPGSADVVVIIGRHERPLAATLAERVWTIRSASE